MQIDHDLLRALLLEIEMSSDGDRSFSIEYFTDKFQSEKPIKVRYHLKYLKDSELIETIQDYVIDITPHGRNYLDSIRNQTIWTETKKKIKPFGSVTLSIISEIAKSLILDRLGL